MWSWVTGNTTEGTAATPQGGAVVIPGLPSPKNDMDFIMAAGALLDDVR